MRVLLTGATGFTGSHVLSILRARNLKVRCLVRRPDLLSLDAWDGVEVVAGDLGDQTVVERAAKDCELLINVASIGFGHAPGVVQAVRSAGVTRAVFISTTAIFTQLNAPSKAVRVEAEEAIRGSELRWTILRPTMIYGTDRDRNICRLIRYLRRYPVLPVFGAGEHLMQPIHVGDLAAGIVNAAFRECTHGREYNLSGAVPLTYNKIVQTLASLMGRRVKLWHLPYRPVVRMLNFAENCGFRFPLKGEQILRLNENKAFEWSDAARDFGFSPRDFARGAADELSSMGIPVLGR